MEIVETEAENPSEVKEEQNKDAAAKEKLFSDENLGKPTDVADDAKRDEATSEPLRINGGKTVTITPEDKVAFLDSVMTNSRFTKRYRLFGGRMDITVRSLTQDELSALAAWAYKQAISDPSWHLSGRGRRYALSAQVAMFNGIELPPLEEPLYASVEADGKTLKPPAWVERDNFWCGQSAGVVSAVLKCITDFDARYQILCNKAEDENFWNPDTP